MLAGRCSHCGEDCPSYLNVHQAMCYLQAKGALPVELPPLGAPLHHLPPPKATLHKQQKALLRALRAHAKQEPSPFACVTRMKAEPNFDAYVHRDAPAVRAAVYATLREVDQAGAAYQLALSERLGASPWSIDGPIGFCPLL